MAAAPWGGVAIAAKNTKPAEIVVVPYPGKGTTSSNKGTNFEPSFQGGTRISPSRPAKARRQRAR
jgi:hypothetical protein